jgi:predicted metal-dependent phosphoesterase TrpH
VRFDLQSHSIHSDGQLPPTEVVRRARDAGVELLALSDHDTIDGVDEALEAAGDGIRVVPAVEISAVQDEYEDLHILGYGIDHDDRELQIQLARFRDDRIARAGRMADALRDLGWRVHQQAIQLRLAQGKTVGRPHLAQAAFNHPDNAQRIADEGLEDFSALLVKYLIPGAPAYRARTFPGVEEAIDLIHSSGGVAVWAHPFWDIEADRAVLDTIARFKGWGIDGVEVFYVTHTKEQVDLLVEACAEHDLLMTGSSDFHGPDHRHFARFLAHELHGHEPRLGPIAG